MVGQKRRPSAIDPVNENFELRPTPVSPFLYGGVANFSWAQHNLRNLHANCTFKRLSSRSRANAGWCSSLQVVQRFALTLQLHMTTTFENLHAHISCVVQCVMFGELVHTQTTSDGEWYGKEKYWACPTAKMQPI